MSGAAGRRLLSVVLPVLVVVALFGVTLSTDHPLSGLDVTVQATPCAPNSSQACPTRPYRALIQVRHAARHEVIAGHRPGASGHMRLNLSPGDYVLVPGPGSAGEPPARARPVRVRVVEDRYVAVTVLYRLVARTPGTVR
jgi:hypothetical protein